MTVCGEKVTGVCVAGKCPYFKRCHPVVWDKYGKIKPKTNEEWFISLPTEEKAEWLENKMTWAAQEQGTFTAKGWEMWLKQPHKPISRGQENGRGDSMIYQDEKGFYFVIDGYKWYLAGLSLSVVCG